MGSQLTRNKEDYLKEIYKLQSRSNRAIKSVEISRKLGVSRPSVSQMLRKLSNERLLTLNGDGVTLTKEGILKARETLRKHQLLEVFFKNILRLKDRFHDEAHRVEHELSDEASDKLEILLKKPSICPDGNPIPKKDSKILELSNIPINRPAKILFSRSSDRSVIERLDALGIVPETKVTVHKRISGGPIILYVRGTEIALGKDISSRIFVELE